MTVSSPNCGGVPPLALAAMRGVLMLCVAWYYGGEDGQVMVLDTVFRTLQRARAMSEAAL